jgi:UDP-glucose 4-epimerase
MRILVTGGAGFIGSAVTDTYLAAGHDVAVVDDLSAGSPNNVDPRARLYRVDVRRPELDEVFADERPEVVSHHAAQVSIRRSVEDPRADASVNVLGSLNVFEAARRHGARRVIFASTGGAIYRDEQPGVPADETRPCRPRTPYAVAKCSVEHYLDYFSATFGLEAVALRYANVYGPRQDPHGEAGVIAIFLQRILAGVAPTIFGDGEQVRDFIYVTDVAAANRAALEAVVLPGETLVINISTGVGTTVNTVWRTIERIAQPVVHAYHEPARSGDVRWSVLDPSRARRAIGWAAAVGVDDGLRSTWEWCATRAGGEAEVA